MFCLHNFLQGNAQRFALPALGRGRRSRPTRKRLRRRKMPGICAESPASGARFVGWRFITIEFYGHQWTPLITVFVKLNPLISEKVYVSKFRKPNF
ncbi:MAG: hypothetical protein KPEEDBHJ_03686 [Anaerolineales bacterium]|nr:hypothetical protein [Anaerolineales bacterium]